MSSRRSALARSERSRRATSSRSCRRSTRQGAGETAGRVFQRLRAIYRYALSEDLVEADPTYPLKPSEIFKPRDVSHRLALAEADMPAFFRKLDAYEGDPSTKAALELLILTAVRPGELRGARWKEIDESRSLWRIPAERMKMATEHLVPLSTQALAILERHEARERRPGVGVPLPVLPRQAAERRHSEQRAGAPWLQGHCHCARISDAVLDVCQRGRLELGCHREAAVARRARRRQRRLQPSAVAPRAGQADAVVGRSIGFAAYRASKPRCIGKGSYAQFSCAPGSSVRDEPRPGVGKSRKPPTKSYFGSSPGTKNALPNPIEVLRALVAAFDQHSSRDPDA